MLRRRGLLLAAIACAALVSCGIKGPLKLPPEKAASPASAPPAPAPASPDGSTTEKSDAAADKKQ
ncbi:MAG TPA: lipoprotein [Casimicrobiaceae bacterium]|nr:lipoprotein [Casimicrobiaceae bacterium]